MATTTTEPRRLLTAAKDQHAAFVERMARLTRCDSTLAFTEAVLMTLCGVDVAGSLQQIKRSGCRCDCATLRTVQPSAAIRCALFTAPVDWTPSAEGCR